MKVRAIRTRINRLREESKLIGSHDVSIKESSSEHKSCRVSKKYAFKGVLEVEG